MYQEVQGSEDQQIAQAGMSSEAPLPRRYNDWDGISEVVGSNVEESRSSSPGLTASVTVSLPGDTTFLYDAGHRHKAAPRCTQDGVCRLTHVDCAADWAHESGLNPYPISSQPLIPTQASQASPIAGPADPPPAATAAAQEQQQLYSDSYHDMRPEQTRPGMPLPGSAPSSGQGSQGMPAAMPGMLSLSQHSHGLSPPAAGVQARPAATMPQMWEGALQEQQHRMGGQASQPGATPGLRGGGGGTAAAAPPEEHPGSQQGGLTQPMRAAGTPAQLGSQGGTPGSSSQGGSQGLWECKWVNRLLKGDFRLGKPCQHCSQPFACALPPTSACKSSSGFRGHVQALLPCEKLNGAPLGH